MRRRATTGAQAPHAPGRAAACDGGAVCARFDRGLALIEELEAEHLLTHTHHVAVAQLRDLGDALVDAVQGVEVPHGDGVAVDHEAGVRAVEETVAGEHFVLAVSADDILAREEGHRWPRGAVGVDLHEAADLLPASRRLTRASSFPSLRASLQASPRAPPRSQERARRGCVRSVHRSVVRRGPRSRTPGTRCCPRPRRRSLRRAALQGWRHSRGRT